jgi:glutamine synthetase
VYTADEKPFLGDPAAGAEETDPGGGGAGLPDDGGVEAEFFLFHLTEDGAPTRTTHDAGGYFDLGPVDLGEIARRRDMVNMLTAMGFEVEAAHHEVAQGQHEIDFKYEDAMTTADHLSTFKFVVRNMAVRHGLHATFMPKPIFGQNGSGMHTHQSLFSNGEERLPRPEKDPDGLSQVMRWYVGGLLKHARRSAWSRTRW